MHWSWWSQWKGNQWGPLVASPLYTIKKFCSDASGCTVTHILYIGSMHITDVSVLYTFYCISIVKFSVFCLYTLKTNNLIDKSIIYSVQTMLQWKFTSNYMKQLKYENMQHKEQHYRYVILQGDKSTISSNIYYNTIRSCSEHTLKANVTPEDSMNTCKEK